MDRLLFVFCAAFLLRVDVAVAVAALLMNI